MLLIVGVVVVDKLNCIYYIMKYCEVFISESECLRMSCSDEVVGENVMWDRWTDLDHDDLFGDNKTKGRNERKFESFCPLTQHPALFD